METYRELMDANPGLCRSVNERGEWIEGPEGKGLKERLLDLYVDVLAPALRGREDLERLGRVLEDAVSLAAGSGRHVSDAILYRFAAANGQGADAACQLFPGAGRDVAVRLRCIDDDRLRAALEACADELAVHMSTREEWASLLAPLLALGRCEWCDPVEVLRGVADLASGAWLGGVGDVCRVVGALLEEGERLQARSIWIQGLWDLHNGLPGSGFGDRQICLARLFRHREALAPFLPLLDGDGKAARAAEAMDELAGTRLGYSDLDADLRRYVPAAMAACAHMVCTVDELERLIQATPGIVKNLPMESESTPLGWIHECDLETFEGQARQWTDLEGFLGSMAGEVEGDGMAEPVPPARKNLFIRVVRTVLLPLFLVIDGLETLLLTLRRGAGSGNGRIRKRDGP